MKVYLAKHGGTTPSDRLHPDFLVLAPSQRAAKTIAENYLLSVNDEYWLQVFVQPASQQNVKTIKGVPIITAHSSE